MEMGNRATARFLVFMREEWNCLNKQEEKNGRKNY